MMQEISAPKQSAVRQRVHAIHLLLAGFILLSLALNIYWIRYNTVPPTWDQAWYLENAVSFYQHLRHEGLPGLWSAYTDAFEIKAPLISLLSLPSFLTIWPGPDTAMIPNLILLVCLNVFLFLLVRQRFSETHALLAVLITSTMPVLVILSHQYLVEYGLTALVVIWMYLLYKSRFYRSRACNLWLGITLGLGLLMKVLFPLYIALPALIAFVVRLGEEPRRQQPRALLDVAIILVVGLAVASTWYAFNWRAVTRFALTASFGENAQDYSLGNNFAWQTIVYYWKILINDALSVYYAACLGLVGLAYLLQSLIRRRRWHVSADLLLLGGWFAAPFAVITVGVNKDPRFLAPALPALGIAIAWLLVAVLGPRVKYAFPLLFVVPALAALYLIAPVEIINLPVQYHGFVLLPDKRGDNPAFACAPRQENWPLVEMLAAIHKDDPGTPRTIYTVVDHPYLNVNTLAYYRTLHAYPLQVLTLAYWPKDAPQSQVRDALNQAQYLILKTGNQGPAFTTWRDDQVRADLEAGALPFQRWQTYDLPDGSVCEIYRQMTN